MKHFHNVAKLFFVMSLLISVSHSALPSQTDVDVRYPFVFVDKVMVGFAGGGEDRDRVYMGGLGWIEDDQVSLVADGSRGRTASQRGMLVMVWEVTVPEDAQPALYRIHTPMWQNSTTFGRVSTSYALSGQGHAKASISMRVLLGEQDVVASGEDVELFSVSRPWLDEFSPPAVPILTDSMWTDFAPLPDSHVFLHPGETLRYELMLSASAAAERGAAVILVRNFLVFMLDDYEIDGTLVLERACLEEGFQCRPGDGRSCPNGTTVSCTADCRWSSCPSGRGGPGATCVGNLDCLPGLRCNRPTIKKVPVNPEHGYCGFATCNSDVECGEDAACWNGRCYLY